MKDKIQYDTRRKKFVSRMLFVELLARIGLYKPLSQYCYFGMGEISCFDHVLLFERLGMDRLVSFEVDATVLYRQKLNRPLPATILQIIDRPADASDVLNNIETMVPRSFIQNRQNRVFWLDFDSAAHLKDQLDTFATAISVMDDGDVIRITLNAQPSSLDDGQIEFENCQEFRMNSFKDRVGDLFPAGLAPANFQHSTYPHVLLSVLRRIVSQALSGFPSYSFEPLLIEIYEDGQQMLVLTGVLISRSSAEALITRTGIATWPFYSRRWVSISKIDLPSLTWREMQAMDNASTDEDRLQIAMSILGTRSTEAATSLLRAIDAYRRYTPNFRHVGSIIS